jgi:hypothetical protein
MCKNNVKNPTLNLTLILPIYDEDVQNDKKVGYMAVTLDLSYEFASLVKKLHESPNNPVLKQEVVSKIPDMIILAKVSPLAQFRLAQMHSPTSPQYKQMMRKSANMGCTNAMLALCEVLLKQEAPTSADLKTAVHYMRMIEGSDDTFILEQRNALLKTNPQVAALMRAECKEHVFNANLNFFSCKQDMTVKTEAENYSQPSL